MLLARVRGGPNDEIVALNVMTDASWFGVLKQGRTARSLLPAAASLVVFAWLLTLHPAAAGRVDAAYGGVYVAVAIVWLWWVDGIRPGPWDIVGSCVALIGMTIIASVPGRG